MIFDEICVTFVLKAIDFKILNLQSIPKNCLQKSVTRQSNHIKSWGWLPKMPLCGLKLVLKGHQALVEASNKNVVVLRFIQLPGLKPFGY